MIDYDKLHETIHEKSKSIIEQHAAIIEENIKQVIVDYDCKPSQIQLRIKQKFTYEVCIMATEFCINNVFTVEANHD